MVSLEFLEVKRISRRGTMQCLYKTLFSLAIVFTAQKSHKREKYPLCINVLETWCLIHLK